MIFPNSAKAEMKVPGSTVLPVVCLYNMYFVGTVTEGERGELYEHGVITRGDT